MTLGKLYLKIFVLVNFDVFRLFWLLATVWLIEQIISAIVEQIVWGGAFAHWLDIAFTVALAWAYAHLASVLADVNLSVIIKPKKGDKL